MREQSNFSSRFWTGETGKQIRQAGRDAQVLASYLITCPCSSAIGLYYLPFPTLLHEVGIGRDEALATLEILSKLEFAFYHAPTETVWVPEMARFQIGEQLKAGDKRIIGIKRQLEGFTKSQFYEAFYDRYCEAFHLGPRIERDEPAPGGMLFDIGEPKPVEPPAVTPDDVINYWREKVGKAQMTKARRNKLNTRLKDKDWPWKEAIDKLPIPNTPTFQWQPDFTWLIANDDNAVKLAEGRYDSSGETKASSRLKGNLAVAAAFARPESPDNLRGNQ